MTSLIKFTGLSLICSDAGKPPNPANWKRGWSIRLGKGRQGKITLNLKHNGERYRFDLEFEFYLDQEYEVLFVGYKGI